MQQPSEQSAKRLRRLQPLRVPDVMDCWDQRLAGQRSRPRGCHCLGARARCAVGRGRLFTPSAQAGTRPPPWTVSQGCCLASGLGDVVGAQVSESGGRSKREEDRSDRRTNQTEKPVGCLGSIPRYHMWEALLSARPQMSVYERGSRWLPRRDFYPLHSLLCGFRGEESGLEAKAAAARAHSTARSPPAGQMRVSPGAFSGWAA